MDERQWNEYWWARSHVGKKKYTTLRKARLVLDQMVRMGHAYPGEMAPYRCKWRDVYEAPPTGKNHYHLGHPNPNYRSETLNEPSAGS